VTGSLSTERLLLRQWRDADIADFAAMSADPTSWSF
jgi:RimJ/RimL family protein N-acetyltransferase